DRVIVLARQQGDGVANANPLGALGESPVEDFRGRTVGKLPQEMVLYRPEVLEADLIGQLDLGHDLLVALLLDAVIVGFGYLNFIHEPEFHGHVLPQARVGVNEKSYPSPLSGRGTCAPAYPDPFGGTAARGRRWAVPPDDSRRETPCLPEVPMDERGHLLERLPGD